MSTSSETLPATFRACRAFRAWLAPRWHAWCRARTRRALLDLDPRLLTDVGLTRNAAGDFVRARPQERSED